MSGSGHGGPFGEEGVVEDYLAGRLPRQDAEAFEAHLLTCERCQREVRFGATVRDELAARPESARRRGLPWLIGLTSAAVLTAAALAAVLLLDGGPAPEVVALGEVRQPPIYLGVAVRDGEGAADSLFDAGMERYQAGDYAAAAAALREAVEADPAALPARFFLGASLLMSGDAAAAAREYRAVVAAGESPYRAEARFYLAKALLQGGEVEAAREQLRAVAADLDDVGEAARDLLAALDRLTPP